MLFTWYKVVKMWWEGARAFLWAGEILHYFHVNSSEDACRLEADSRFYGFHARGNSLQVDPWPITASFRSSRFMERHKWHTWWSERMKLPCEIPTAAKILILSPGPTGIHYGGHPPFSEKFTNKAMTLKMLSVLILMGAEDWKVWARGQPEFKGNSQKGSSKMFEQGQNDWKHCITSRRVFSEG